MLDAYLLTLLFFFAGLDGEESASSISEVSWFSGSRLVRVLRVDEGGIFAMLIPVGSRRAGLTIFEDHNSVQLLLKVELGSSKVSFAREMVYVVCAFGFRVNWEINLKGSLVPQHSSPEILDGRRLNSC